MTQQPNLQHTQLIFCFGAGRSQDKKGISPIGIQRYNKGIELFKSGYGDKFIVLGGWLNSLNQDLPLDSNQYPSTREIYLKYLGQNNISQRDIISNEGEVPDTFMELFELKKIIDSSNGKYLSITLVSSESHFPRIQMIAQKIFGKKFNIQYVFVPDEFPDSPEGRIQQENTILRENQLRTVTNRMFSEYYPGDDELIPVPIDWWQWKESHVEYYKDVEDIIESTRDTVTNLLYGDHPKVSS